MIEGYDRHFYQQIKTGWDKVAKPLDSMGLFEEFLSRIGAIQGRSIPDVKRSRLLVCCADNGIVEEGVSQSGQEITAICADSIANGRSSVAIMAREAGVEVLTLDVGINTNQPIKNVRNEKICKGTRNFLKEPAMTMTECQKALELGQNLVEESKKEGFSILAIGEMGIGNTTTSAAITAALLGLQAEEVTGRGAGLNDEKFLNKQAVIRRALEKYGYAKKVEQKPDPVTNQTSNPVTARATDQATAQAANQATARATDQATAQATDQATAQAANQAPDQISDQTIDRSSPQAFDVLCNLGGFDIACMAGICIGGAKHHVPIVLDGFISLAAALVACRMEPVVAEYLIPSHSGKEIAMKRIEQELGLSPVIYGNMALGEGTGAVMMLQLLKTANAVYENSQSFETAGIAQYERYTVTH